MHPIVTRTECRGLTRISHSFENSTFWNFVCLHDQLSDSDIEERNGDIQDFGDDYYLITFNSIEFCRALVLSSFKIS